VAKRVEMVQHFRSTHASGNASKNVNECSFMERIVLLSFNGPVLCHMIASNAVFKLNLHVCVSRPRTQTLIRSGQEAKTEG
jgi:hypothetical protein